MESGLPNEALIYDRTGTVLLAGVQEAVVGGRPAWFLPGTSASTPAPPLPASVHSSG